MKLKSHKFKGVFFSSIEDVSKILVPTNNFRQKFLDESNSTLT